MRLPGLPASLLASLLAKLLAKFLVWPLAAIALPIAGGAALSQTSPSQPITLIVPYAAGGVADLLGRLAAEHIKNRTGQSVVVENRAGAGGNTGLAAVAAATPDGATLGLAAVTNFLVNPYIYKSMPFDPMKDLIPVAPVAEGPQLLVVPSSLAVKTLAEFIAYAKANPDKMNYGSAGTGTPNHLSTDYFLRTAGIKAAHLPYRGAAPAVTDLLTGNLQMMVIAPAPLAGHVETGTLRALAAVAAKRLPAYPDVPTVAEQGLPPYDMANWYGLVAPAATPRPIVETLNALIVSMADQPDIARKFTELFMEPMRVPSDAFAHMIRTDAPKWEKITKDAGITPE